MTNHSEARRFLQELFPDHAQHAIFASGHAPTHSWFHVRSIEALRDDRDCYLSPAAFPNDGSDERTLARALEVRCLVIDDVGAEVTAEAVEQALGKPTAEVLTSAGSAHWWYVLQDPIPVKEWGAFFAEVARRIGKRTHGPEAHHVFRIPMGVNTKPERNGFKPRLGQFNPGLRLDAAGIMLFAEPVPASPKAAGGTQVSPAGLRELLGLIPNKAAINRDEWVSIGHWAKGLCPEGREVFVEWTLGWEGTPEDPSTHTEESIGHSWDGFGNGGLLSQGGRLRAMAERVNPEGFRRWDARSVFDDGEELPALAPDAKTNGITATPFKWVDPAKIPPRAWLYGNILIRKFISMTVAPGGVGKSSLIAVETLAQVTGRDLLGERPAGVLRVWLWNLEDPHEETQRKLLAAASHYGIDERALGDRLFVDSGRDQRLVVAEMDRTGPMIVRPVIGALVEQIRARGIDVVVIDPFVSCHAVPENDNMAQDMVVKEWGRVAEQGNCAVHLVDHTRKAPAGTEVSTESSRGAKAKTDAARVVRVVNRMTDGQSKPWGVVNPWRYFSTFNDKANMAPPVDRRDWFYLESVALGNGGGASAAFGVGAGAVQGDSVGVVKRWMPPSSQDLVTGASFKAMVEAMGTEEWRKAPHAGEKWIGNAAAKALELDPKNTQDRNVIKEVVAQWFKAGLLKEVAQLDEHRKQRTFIKIVGGF